MGSAELRARLVRAGATGRARLYDHLSEAERAFIGHDFALYRHGGQAPPEGAWRNWVLMAGRGFGKTRAGAEWVWSLVRHAAEPLRIALVGATIDEARNVMVEGPSGILALQQPGELMQWHAARGMLTFRGGSQAQLFSGAHGERLRGPEHHYAWCDELAKWKQGGEMIRSVLIAANPLLPLTIVHAGAAKTARAEPVAALFENGRAFFAGRFPRLEEQLAGMIAGGDYEGPRPSPDRADAMVWALHALMLKPVRVPSIRRFD
jgi:phage terminase large subunit-like protein